MNRKSKPEDCQPLPVLTWRQAEVRQLLSRHALKRLNKRPGGSAVARMQFWRGGWHECLVYALSEAVPKRRATS